MRQSTIYIILTVIVCVVVIASAIYVVDNMDSDTEDSTNDTSNTTNNTTNTTNDSVNKNTSDNSSSDTDNDSGTTSSTLDYSDYETGQTVGSNGVINLSDQSGASSYEGHKEWQQRQVDKLEADGYSVTSSNVDGISNGYDAYDSNGRIVVHINY